MICLTTIEKELAYYVSYDALPAVQKNYVFAEQVNPICSLKSKTIGESLSKYQNTPFVISVNGVF